MARIEHMAELVTEKAGARNAPSTPPAAALLDVHRIGEYGGSLGTIEIHCQIMGKRDLLAIPADVPVDDFVTSSDVISAEEVIE